MKSKLSLKMIAIAVGLIFMLAFAGDDTIIDNKPFYYIDNTDYYKIAEFVPKSFTFCGDSSNIVITLNDTIDVTYDGPVTDAAKDFFEHFKKYINSYYYIIPIDSTIFIDPQQNSKFKWICIDN